MPVASGRVTITARDAAGEVAWVVHARESSGEIVGHASTMTLTGVEGELRSKGRVVSTFAADAADADQATRSLDLRGHVVVRRMPDKAEGKTPAEPLTLTADRAKWLDDRKVVAAQGSVWVRSSVYEMGEYAELWATEDLGKIGTPDRFAR